MTRWPARRTVAALVAAVAVLVGAATAAGVGPLGAGSSSSDERPLAGGLFTGEEVVPGVGPQGAAPQFVVSCDWSHSAPDDPIVHAGHPGRSHLHDFFGATSVDAATSPEDLRGADTTCAKRSDTASYWTPALLRDGDPVRPSGSVAYYRPGHGVDPRTVAAPPAGLVVVAGDPVATAPQPLGVAAWRCGSSPSLHSEPPACPPGAPLSVRITFPDCWDGRRLDSPDHTSHLARSTDGSCPDEHPVPIAQLTFEVRYPVSGDPSGLELASGGVHSLHADFMNAWDQDALEREVRICLNGERVCGVVSSRTTG